MFENNINQTKTDRVSAKTTLNSKCNWSVQEGKKEIKMFTFFELQFFALKQTSCCCLLPVVQNLYSATLQHYSIHWFVWQKLVLYVREQVHRFLFTQYPGLLLCQLSIFLFETASAWRWCRRWGTTSEQKMYTTWVESMQYIFIFIIKSKFSHTAQIFIRVIRICKFVHEMKCTLRVVSELPVFYESRDQNRHCRIQGDIFYSLQFFFFIFSAVSVRLLLSCKKMYSQSHLVSVFLVPLFSSPFSFRSSGPSQLNYSGFLAPAKFRLVLIQATLMHMVSCFKGIMELSSLHTNGCYFTTALKEHFLHTLFGTLKCVWR